MMTLMIIGMMVAKVMVMVVVMMTVWQQASNIQQPTLASHNQSAIHRGGGRLVCLL